MLAIAPAILAVAALLDTGNPDRRTAAAVFMGIAVYTWIVQAICHVIHWITTP